MTQETTSDPPWLEAAAEAARDVSDGYDGLGCWSHDIAFAVARAIEGAGFKIVEAEGGKQS